MQVQGILEPVRNIQKGNKQFTNKRHNKMSLTFQLQRNIFVPKKLPKVYS